MSSLDRYICGQICKRLNAELFVESGQKTDIFVNKYVKDRRPKCLWTNVKSGQDEGDKGWTKDEEGEGTRPGQWCCCGNQNQCSSAAEIKIKVD